MSRFVLVLAVAGLMSMVPSGPSAAAGPLHAGVKAGMNIANQSMDTSDAELSDSRNGLAVGAWLRLPATPMFSVQPEALFTMKGDSQKDYGTMKVNYLEVPVLATVALTKASTAKPSLFLGPSLGFNLSAKAEDDASGLGVDVKDYTNTVDFGMVVGGGLEYNNLGLDVRYTHGFSNVNDTGSGDEVKNSVFSIMGSISFL